MKKRITEYRKRVDRLLADEEEKTYEEWECILEEHLVQIGFFQHERLIHLIVTVTFAVITVLSLFAPLLTGIMTLYVKFHLPQEWRQICGMRERQKYDSKYSI